MKEIRKKPLKEAVIASLKSLKLPFSEWEPFLNQPKKHST